ncbi:MAG: MotA/TolQ/ExbB proton channel family protein [Gemmataceae bacterium]|nr:MotA/TolQ/ExbB proton channel family protein [Gemmataceae bacterium]
MTDPQSAVRDRPAAPRSWAMPLGLLLGVPAGVGLLVLVHDGPLQETLVARYLSHPVEWAEVVLFCVALVVLAVKACGTLVERAAGRAEPLPPWDGRPAPVSAAGPLLTGLRGLSRRVQGTYLVRRVAAVLDFVIRRRSANDLDDQLRTLSDNDALALDNSYSLLRFITWAIPILGFLGTVVGITDAIAGVTPETLEQSLSQVTDGLATAFDTTALALALTMVLMFVTSLTERLEQGAVAEADQYADAHLAHRFERAGPDGGAFVETVRHGTDTLIHATEELVQRQAEVWAQALGEVERRAAAAGQRQQELLTGALEAALAHTLESHQRRLMELERQALERHGSILEALAGLAAHVREASAEQQAALARVADGLAGQAQALAQLQQGEAQLVRLQESLQRNLDAVVRAGAFEDALHSLTAAVHLLTARAAAPAARLAVRPEAA